MLHECNIPFNLFPVDLLGGDQFTPEFEKLNPNHKIPVIVDRKGPEGNTIQLFESAAILSYLAEKAGKFLPKTPQGPLQSLSTTSHLSSERYLTLQWLMWQGSYLAPILSQAFHFKNKPKDEDTEYSQRRFYNEALKVTKILNTQLVKKEFIVGSQYTIADMACFPLVKTVGELDPIDLANFPELERWIGKLEGRKGVQKAMEMVYPQHKMPVVGPPGR